MASLRKSKWHYIDTFDAVKSTHGMINKLDVQSNSSKLKKHT